ncbi:MAG: hypothetical protein SV429_13170 [Pseudomonadota bacterium]|nr:hypothetical protein [Pseudomonadota bacterium]
MLANLVRWCQFNVVYKLLSPSRDAKKSLFALFLQAPDSDYNAAEVVTVKASEVHQATGDVQTAVAALKVCVIYAMCVVCAGKVGLLVSV